MSSTGLPNWPLGWRLAAAANNGLPYADTGDCGPSVLHMVCVRAWVYSPLFSQDCLKFFPCVLCAQAVAEYIWLDSDGQVRSRTKVLEGSIPQDCENLPCLVVDARVPGDAEGADDLYEVVLRPRKIFKDPFRSGNSILVLCDAYEPPAVSTLARLSNRVYAWSLDNLAKKPAQCEADRCDSLSC